MSRIAETGTFVYLNLAAITLVHIFAFCDDVGIVNGQFCTYLVRSKYESFILANSSLINDPCRNLKLNMIFDALRGRMRIKNL